jgi:hypothetical protein
MPTESDTPDSEAIAPLESVSLPLRFLRAALQCASTDLKNREHLCGVHIRAEGDCIRVTGTDGVVLFTSTVYVPTGVPTWAQRGVTLHRDGLKSRLAIFGEGEGIDNVQVGFSANRPTVSLFDSGEATTFRVVPLELPYCDFSAILADLATVMGNRACEVGETASFAPKVMRYAVDVAKTLDSNAIALFAGGQDDSLALATFADAPGAALVLWPVQNSAPALTHETLRTLGPSVKMQRAGYLANMNRTIAKLATLDKGSEEYNTLNDKIATYQVNIAACDQAMTGLPLLPAAPPPPAIAAPVAPATPPAAQAAPKGKGGKGKGTTAAA